METLCWSYHGFRVLSCPNSYFPSNSSKNTSSPNIKFNLRRSHSRTHSPSPGSIQDHSFQSVNKHSDHLWSALELAEAVGGEVIQWGPPGTISTDTQKLVPGQWFFALIGPNFDGHKFIHKSLALDKGCIGVVGNRMCDDWPAGFIKVEGDTMVALEKLARYARDRFRGLVIGLTGSVGKTTTRTMIAHALESLGNVYQTPGNLNYIVGVALTVSAISLDVAAAVVELGMSGQRGEILKMARMCRPRVRVVLNVGHCHMEHFRTLDDVARAKGELLTEAEPGDICVLNADDPFVMNMPVADGVKKVLFGRRIGCDVRLVLAECVDGGRAVRVVLESKSEMVEFKLHGPGLHLAVNACAAAAVAASLGVPLPQIGKSLSKFRPVHMRSQMEVSQHGITIINDTYNASLPSMIAAINSLSSIDCCGRKIVILGDMLELGEEEGRTHELVLKLCCDACLSIIILVGDRFLSGATSLNLVGRSNIICVPDSAFLVPKVSEFVAPGDVVLVKGSRGMKMEKVVDAIMVIED